MGFVYSTLCRLDCEDRGQFDRRIARMLPFAAGKAYFDIRNYDGQTGEFNVYIAWDAEVNDCLAYELPAGGYFVKATLAQAYDMHDLEDGITVYMKLTSRQGQLYPYRTYILFDGRPFSLEFGGGMLLPMDDRYEQLAYDSGESGGSQNPGGSQRRLAAGSQSLGGSQRRLVAGSQSLGGSQRRLVAGSQSLGGSQRRLVAGSQSLGGSQRRWHRKPENKAHAAVRDSNEVRNELMLEFPQEWQLINRQRRPSRSVGGNARFGYGLDLIWDTEDL